MLGAIMVVIVWQLDLQQPVQSVPITTKVVTLKLVHGEVYSKKHHIPREDLTWLKKVFSYLID
jgi:hypothetical protein